MNPGVAAVLRPTRQRLRACSAHPSSSPPLQQNPVCVVLQLEAAAADSGRGSGSGKTGTRRSSRRLLDAEKVMFRTDNFGRVRVPGGSAVSGGAGMRPHEQRACFAKRAAQEGCALEA